MLGTACALAYTVYSYLQVQRKRYIFIYGLWATSHV